MEYINSNLSGGFGLEKLHEAKWGTQVKLDKIQRNLMIISYLMAVCFGFYLTVMSVGAGVAQEIARIAFQAL